MTNEIGKLFGVPVVENKYLPKDTILVMGNHCRHCHMRFSSVWDACFASPDGHHFPEYKFVKTDSGREASDE
jgi:hypothetical protein